jgi:hypothetical protein
VCGADPKEKAGCGAKGFGGGSVTVTDALPLACDELPHAGSKSANAIKTTRRMMPTPEDRPSG